jgi:NAD(P)-dependent dehydrogenase (short-subunit alcohol dehydrogenase family)
MNKTILITGAAKRIGKEIALTYCELGWNIIIHYNSSKKRCSRTCRSYKFKKSEYCKNCSSEPRC